MNDFIVTVLLTLCYVWLLPGEAQVQSSSAGYGASTDITGDTTLLTTTVSASGGQQYDRESQFTTAAAGEVGQKSAVVVEGEGEDQGPTAGAVVNAYLAAFTAHPAVAAAITTTQWIIISLLDQIYGMLVYLTQHNRITGLTPAGDRLLTSFYRGFNSFYQSLTGHHPAGTDPTLLNNGFFTPKVLKMEGFKGSPEATQAYYSTQVYADGERCVPGHRMPRSSVVYLQCGTVTELLDVVETQVHYATTCITTAITACTNTTTATVYTTAT